MFFLGGVDDRDDVGLFVLSLLAAGHFWGDGGGEGGLKVEVEVEVEAESGW